MCVVLSFDFSCFRSGEACNHVGALMYALADLTAKKMEGKLASRSKMCVGRFQQPKTEKTQPKEGK